jgi:flagellar motor switch protein FliN/FliY
VKPDTVPRGSAAESRPELSIARPGDAASAGTPPELATALAFGDVPLAVEVELDRRPLTVREILRLVPGSVLKMARSAGENIDIRVGGVLTGFGEIVILEDRMGVRITDFVQHEELA